MPEAASSPDRFHSLDAVRAFALLLGVVFHAAESFGPNNHYWAIVDCSPSQLLEDIRFACHSFRLELFYMMAGFFGRLLLVRRGTRAFVHNRTQRIVVPLVVGWVVLYPMLVLIWLWGSSVSGRLIDFGVPQEAVKLPVLTLWIGFFLSGGFLQKFDLTHLWFLHQLLVLYVICLGFRWVFKRVEARLMPGLDRVFGAVVRSRLSVGWLALLTFPMMLVMDGWGVDTPKESLLPHLPTTLLFGFCFLLGWMWHRQPELLEYPGRWWWAYLGIGVLAWLGFGLLRYDLAGDPEARQWVRLQHMTLYPFMMWGLALGFLGLFVRFCRRPSSSTRYIAEASYWIYLAHLPLVVALQVAFGRLPWPWPLKLSLILVIAFAVLLLSYQYLVRGTFIGAQLNGRRYPRTWPWQRQPGRGV